MPREGRVAAVLLAAGSSTRMGRNKLLLPLDGDTVVRRAIKVARDAGLDPVIVVLGHDSSRIEEEIDDLGCRTVFNPDHETGIHTSVRAGVAGLADEADAAIVMLPDMPFVTAAMLTTLVERYRSSHAPLVISRYGADVNAPPMLYDRQLFGELSVMQRRCGREVVQRHRDEAVEVEWPESALSDLDRPEDYDRIRAEIGQGRHE